MSDRRRAVRFPSEKTGRLFAGSSRLASRWFAYCSTLGWVQTSAPAYEIGLSRCGCMHDGNEGILALGTNPLCRRYPPKLIQMIMARISPRLEPRSPDRRTFRSKRFNIAYRPRAERACSSSRQATKFPRKIITIKVEETAATYLKKGKAPALPRPLDNLNRRA